MRWAMIRKEDISNGPGIRTSIYVQGCSHHCKGCFNPETWDFNSGNLWTKEIQNKFIALANSKTIVGFSILGGEPLQQGEEMLELVTKIKNTYPDKSIWMWTGYRYEELNELQTRIVSKVDVLIDGKFEIENKNPSLRFRGSSNQRVIDIHETILNDKIVLLDI